MVKISLGRFATTRASMSKSSLSPTKVKQKTLPYRLNSAIPYFALVIDEEGQCLNSNYFAYLEHFPLPSRNIANKKLERIFTTEITKLFYGILQQVLQGAHSLSMQYRLVGLDGRCTFLNVAT